MRLAVVAGPHTGRTFDFDGHDTFLVGRSSDCHFQLSYDDPYFSRRHFLVEVNAPRCRIIELNSRNGILLNGVSRKAAEIFHGDQITVGQTIFQVSMVVADPIGEVTLELPSKPMDVDITVARPRQEPARPSRR